MVTALDLIQWVQAESLAFYFHLRDRTYKALGAAKSLAVTVKDLLFCIQVNDHDLKLILWVFRARSDRIGYRGEYLA